MKPAAQLSLLLSWGALSYAKQFIWFAFKVFLSCGIGWGLFRSLDLFPIEIVGYWQGQLRNLSFSFSFWEYFEWIADNWLQMMVLVIAIAAVRSYRILRNVVQTSGHAAFVTSAIANYMEVEPMTPELLRIERARRDDIVHLSLTLWIVSLKKRIFSILSQVPFLPDDAIPVRKGEVVKYREDLREYLSIATNEHR